VIQIPKGGAFVERGGVVFTNKNSQLALTASLSHDGLNEMRGQKILAQLIFVHETGGDGSSDYCTGGRSEIDPDFIGIFPEHRHRGKPGKG